MIIIIFVDVMREQYIAKHSWRDSIIIGLLSLTGIVLFIVAKVDEMEPWLWLLGIVVAINGILFYRNYQKRSGLFSPASAQNKRVFAELREQDRSF